MTLSQLRKKLAKGSAIAYADAAGLSPMTVRRITAGTNTPNMKTFDRLCKAVAGRRSPPKKAAA